MLRVQLFSPALSGAVLITNHLLMVGYSSTPLTPLVGWLTSSTTAERVLQSQSNLSQIPGRLSDIRIRNLPLSDWWVEMEHKWNINKESSDIVSFSNWNLKLKQQFFSGFWLLFAIKSDFRLPPSLPWEEWEFLPPVSPYLGPWFCLCLAAPLYKSEMSMFLFCYRLMN